MEIYRNFTSLIHRERINVQSDFVRQTFESAQAEFKRYCEKNHAKWGILVDEEDGMVVSTYP